MPVFRKITPKRRLITKKVGHYREHRETLKEDFNNRCGYCDDVDSFRRAYYEIDHFVPKNILEIFFSVPEEYNEKVKDYSNLVYSCHFCNNAKRKKWPTGRLDIHNDNNIGFIDPCNEEYDKQFERNENGEIIPKTELGNWIYEALKLWKSEHFIIWHLDELNQSIKELKNLLAIGVQEEDLVLKQKLNLAFEDFYKYYKQLTEY
jgi:uncharacterized protein (TIGR02646 family)